MDQCKSTRYESLDDSQNHIFERKAVTTPLIAQIFGKVFKHQIDFSNVPIKKNCQLCEGCQVPPCGNCKCCKRYEICSKIVCTADSDDLTSSSEDESDTTNLQQGQKLSNGFLNASQQYYTRASDRIERKVKFLHDPIKADALKIYYTAVYVDDILINIGDFVLLRPPTQDMSPLIGQVSYLYHNTKYSIGEGHMKMLIRSTDTILGVFGNGQEVFALSECCDNVPLSSILKTLNVRKLQLTGNGFYNKRTTEIVQNELKGKYDFYFHKHYNRFEARFEDLKPDIECPSELIKHRYCSVCERTAINNIVKTPRLVGKLSKNSKDVGEPDKYEWTAVHWKGCVYRKGCGVLLRPGTFNLENEHQFEEKFRSKPVDESIYTEYFRKNVNIKGSNEDTEKPFCVGFIIAVFTYDPRKCFVSPFDIYLRINILYRPENTSRKNCLNEDCDKVYWSDEIIDVSLLQVVGLCDLYYENIKHSKCSKLNFIEAHSRRFYFNMSYDKTTGKFSEVPIHARLIGKMETQGATSNNIITPLRTLDVFAGCGGLSSGLSDVGLADCKWAIEQMQVAAESYSLNHPDCLVFDEDCNIILQQVMRGDKCSMKGMQLPKQGDVELLCGGPPCQGFSEMNRFSTGDCSALKNSLVATYLSFCDYYRPKYFILENVRNFIAFKKGVILKLVLFSLLEMGYQCTFGLLQAGNYGVPQARRRLFVIAAAPGLTLPLYPEPSHVFNKHAGSLKVNIDGNIFHTNIKWVHSAPRRTCTVYDAISDLPVVGPDAPVSRSNIVNFIEGPKTHFQRLARKNCINLTDHIFKSVTTLNQLRINLIPKYPGSDWRDLPNSSLPIHFHSRTSELEYTHHVSKKGVSENGRKRGVCACASKGRCDSMPQPNTIIPWGVVHTASRNNNWAGVFGRISWSGYFGTTITNPEPMGKQGRVLHPEQKRIVSVRECARSQGFHDDYKLAGTMRDRYLLIGNAVPPPVARAIGKEFVDALTASGNYKPRDPDTWLDI